MKRTLIAAALLAAGLSALPVLAQGPGQGFGRGRGMAGPGAPGGRGPGGPGGPGGGPGILAAVHHLNLTDAQREQLRALMEESRQPGEPGQDVRAAEQKLHAAILADSPDLQAIEGLKTALNRAHADGLNRRIELMQRVAQILTPAQRQELASHSSQGPSRGRGRAGRGR